MPRRETLRAAKRTVWVFLHDDSRVSSLFEALALSVLGNEAVSPTFPFKNTWSRPLGRRRI